ncbi:MAG: hypothetical protein LJE65_05065, partial [Desulfobacteraceae bacterium]|nr:hypothetical protein [Desulfobacteraceae bacterium]
MMKDIRYNISLYVIIPIIFSGIALLSILLSYNITGFYMRKGADPEGPIMLWTSLILVLSAVIGLLIVRMLLSPLRKFVEETEKLGVLKSLPKNGRSIE